MVSDEYTSEKTRNNKMKSAFYDKIAVTECIRNN